MYLNSEEKKIANNVNSFIRNYANLVDRIVNKCKTCNGTGLYGVHFHEQGASWDGVSYCNSCKGTGYDDWDNTILVVCDFCKGSGCRKCEQKGVVDWIEAMRLGIRK